MWLDIKRIYRDSGAFARALPFLFLIPALIEFALHVIEIRVGMYDSRAAARAVSMDDPRLSLGYAKVLALILPGYWFVRYMAWDRNAAKARAVERLAVLLFAVQFAIVGALQWYSLFGPPIGAVLGLEGKAATNVTVAVTLIQSVISVYLIAWFVAWPLGNAAIGPVRSFAVMAGSFWRAVGYVAAGFVPLIALHYALGFGAMGLPRAIVWAMMTVDAVVVGLLALTGAGANYMAAARAAERKGVALQP